MLVFKVFAYKHFFAKTLVQISTSNEVNHLISKNNHQKQNAFQLIWETLVALMEIDFHYEMTLLSSIWPNTISKLSKPSKLYHFNVLKCSFFFIVNSWQKFKSLISVFKPSQCCIAAIYCFSLTSKQIMITYLRRR